VASEKKGEKLWFLDEKGGSGQVKRESEVKGKRIKIAVLGREKRCEKNQSKQPRSTNSHQMVEKEEENNTY